MSECLSQRLRAQAAVVHADGADEQGGVLCALLALQTPAHAASVMEVNEEVQAAEQTPDPASRMGNIPHPDLIGGGGIDRPWPMPAGAAGAVAPHALAVLAEDA